MAVGDALTADYQLEFFGGNDEIETVVIGNGENGVEIVELDLWSGAAMRTSDINRPLDDGQFAGEDFYSGRSINVAFEIWANTEAEIYDRWFEMSRIWRLRRNPKTMAVRLPDWPSDLFVDVRPRRVSGLRVDEAMNVGYVARGVVGFHSVDPRWYSTTLDSTSVGVTTASGGLTFNAAAPLVFGAVGDSGSFDCQNLGNYPTYPTFTITGPITNPSIENQQRSKTLSFTGSLASGETLVIDTQARTVLLNGTASRYSWLDDPTKWFSLAANTTSTLRFLGTTAGSPTLQTTWRSAWV